MSGLYLDKPWVTATGQKLLVAEMSDDHLLNAQTFLERRLTQEEFRVVHRCDGTPCVRCHTNGMFT